MTATLTKWYDQHGRHEIFAGGRSVKLNSVAHTLRLNAEHVAAGRQTDLDEKGIAKTAREEKLRARDAKLKSEDHERMAKLYRQVVLKEEDRPDLVQIGGMQPAPAPAESREEIGAFGD